MFPLGTSAESEEKNEIGRKDAGEIGKTEGALNSEKEKAVAATGKTNRLISEFRKWEIESGDTKKAKNKGDNPNPAKSEINLQGGGVARTMALLEDRMSLSSDLRRSNTQRNLRELEIMRLTQSRLN